MRNARVAIALVLATSTAHADHDHGSAPSADDDGLMASVGVLAARYRSRFYEGNYEGATLGVTWRSDRYEVAARGAAYQIDRNGLTYRGFGDVMVHGAFAIVEREHAAMGAHLMIMIPTGDEMEGLGMGHFMLMPAIWGTWSRDALVVGGSLGYARGIGHADTHAEHGGGAAWPLVDPMSFSEVTFDTTAMYTVASGLGAGTRIFGAIPLDDDVRVIGAARLAWRAGRLETTVEAQAGLAGDPFRFRGVVSTAMSF